jgi:hypothetical protein
MHGVDLTWLNTSILGLPKSLAAVGKHASFELSKNSSCAFLAASKTKVFNVPANGMSSSGMFPSNLV